MEESILSKAHVKQKAKDLFSKPIFFPLSFRFLILILRHILSLQLYSFHLFSIIWKIKLYYTSFPDHSNDYSDITRKDLPVM